MKISLLRKLVKIKPYSIIVLIVLSFFLLSGLFSSKIVSYFNTNWRAISERRIAEESLEIQNIFFEKEKRLQKVTEKLESDMKYIGNVNDNNFDSSPEKYFVLFRKFSDKYNIDFQLVKNREKLLIWNNKSLRFDFSKFNNNADSAFIIHTTNFNSYNIFIKKIFSKGDTEFFLIAIEVLISDYKINNPYIIKRTFFKEKEDINITIDFKPEENIDDSTLVFYKIFKMYHINGDLAGRIFVEKFEQSTVTEGVQDSIIKLQKVMILILIFIFYIYLYRDFRKIRSNFLKGVTISFFLWLFRYLLHYLEVPVGLVDANILSPVYFSSSLGNGIVQSPLELMITAVFAFINSGYIFLLTRIWYIEKINADISVWKKIYRGLVSLIIIALLPLVLRAYSETFRSFIFDSSLKFFEDGTIIPSIPFILMHINVFIASLSFILLLMTTMTIAIRSFCEIKNIYKNQTYIIFVTGLFLISSVLFKYFFNDEQFSYWFLVILIVGLLFVFNSYTGLNTVLNFKLFIYIIIISSFSAVFLLLEKNNFKEKELQKRIALELSKPKEIMTGFILNETLMNLSNKEILINNLRDLKTSNIDYIAYQLWIESILNAEGIKSGIVFLNNEFKNVGFFGFGVKDPGELSSYLNQEIFREEFIFFKPKKFSDYLFGAAKIHYNGEVIGYLIIYILTKTNLNEITPSKVFANIQDERNPILLLPEVLIYKYNGGEFRLEKGENLPEFRQLPKNISERVMSKNNYEIWLDEEIENKEVKTYYYLYNQNEIASIIAVSLEPKPLLWYSYNFFRIVFIHFLISVFFIFIIILILVFRKYRFQIHFKSKMFSGLVFVTLLPLLLLAFYNRQNAIERWNQTQKYELQKDLDYLEANIKELPGFSESDERADTNGKESINLKNMQKISDRIKTDFDIFYENSILYSTESKLYNIDFFDGGLPAKIYEELILYNKNYSFIFENIDEYEYLVGFKKLKIDDVNQILISIPTIYKKEKVDSEIAKIDAFIFGAYSITLLFIFILGNIIFERISKPLKKLTEATQKISAGNLNVKLEPDDKTEVGDLVIAFNKMIADLEESRRNLAAAEREYAWKEMAKQVAHEIKNPLTPMKLSLQHLQLLFKVNKSEFIKMFGKVSNTMVEQIDTLNSIASEFSRFARMPDRNLVKINLVKLIEKVIELFSSNISINFEYESNNEFLILADYEEFKRVIINLIKNSVQAKASKMDIFLNSDKNISLKITDNGEGIPPEIMARIFEPNFSTKSEGMGLGLSIIKKIINELGGEIKMESELLKGTNVFIILKIYDEQTNTIK